MTKSTKDQIILTPIKKDDADVAVSATRSGEWLGKDGLRSNLDDFSRARLGVTNLSIPKEHHYVPQFYFRNFSHDPARKTINLLRKINGQIVLDAPIKSQSRRRNLYVNPEIERVFSQIEGEISDCFHALITGATCFSELRRREAIHYRTSVGLLLQSMRLPQRGEGFHASFLPVFQIAMQIEVSKNPDLPSSIRDDLESGKLFFDYDSRYDVLDAARTALVSAVLFLDMTMLLVANATDLPFVFSDEPAISTNRLLWEYREMCGIAGLGSRGLIAFMPLCEHLAVLFFDGGVYMCNGSIDRPIVLNDRSQIGLINAFQAHSANDVIYFGNQNSGDYVQRLHCAHRGSAKKDRFIVKSAFSADGNSELIHQFERAIPITPDFSFLELRRKPTSDDPRLPRNEELMKVAEGMLQASSAQDGSFSQEFFETTINHLFQKTTALRDRC